MVGLVRLTSSRAVAALMKCGQRPRRSFRNDKVPPPTRYPEAAIGHQLPSGRPCTDSYGTVASAKSTRALSRTGVPVHSGRKRSPATVSVRDCRPDPVGGVTRTRETHTRHC